MFVSNGNEDISIILYLESVNQLRQTSLNPIKAGEVQGFWPITLEVIKMQSRNLVTFPKI